MPRERCIIRSWGSAPRETAVLIAIAVIARGKIHVVLPLRRILGVAARRRGFCLYRGTVKRRAKTVRNKFIPGDNAVLDVSRVVGSSERCDEQR